MKGEYMRKALFMALVTIALVTTAYAYTPFSGSDISGDKKFCHYLDGSVVVVYYTDMCPMSN